MNHFLSKRRGTACVLAACAYFFCAGCALIPHLGVQDDETLFAQAIYPPRYELFAVHLGRFSVPLMLMSYLGALKSWVYWPILHVFGAGIATLRVPMLMAGVASVWLLYLLLRRTAGEAAAVIGCCLLAADSTYLVTTCFDWGPVALQHLLVLAGMLLLMKFYQERGTWALAGGFFLFGLALWDKALAVWMLSGLAVAAMTVFPRRVLQVLTFRRAVIGGLALALGALPLIVFNATTSFRTLRDNLHRDGSQIARKAEVLRDTAGGYGLFGYLTAEDSATPSPHHPAGAWEMVSARISGWAGHPRRSLLLYAFVLALVLSPLATRERRRAILFCLIAMAVAWIQMATTANAGASVHHTILLWPLPEMVIALALAGLPRRFGRFGFLAVAAVMAAVIMPGVLVANEYRVVMLRNGGGPAWNTAIIGLSDYLQGVRAKYVLCLDWGILDPLRLLQQGRLPLAFGNVEVSKPELNAQDREAVFRMISEPANVFITHTAAFEVFPGASEKLLQFAAEAGYQRQRMAEISDTFGRRVFEVYRFTAASR